jgi:hypothetical protein
VTYSWLRPAVCTQRCRATAVVAVRCKIAYCLYSMTAVNFLKISWNRHCFNNLSFVLLLNCFFVTVLRNNVFFCNMWRRSSVQPSGPPQNPANQGNRFYIESSLVSKTAYFEILNVVSETWFRPKLTSLTQFFVGLSLLSLPVFLEYMAMLLCLFANIFTTEKWWNEISIS